MKDELTNIFLFFSKKITGYESQIEGKTLDNFIKLLSTKYDLNTLGEWFVWHYVAFQFAYWYDKQTRMEGRIPFNWIFGPKSFRRWIDKNEDWLYFTNLFLNKTEVKKPIEFYQQNMLKIFEDERKRYINTNMGYIHCQNTAQYSPKSPSCIICKYRKECLKMIS